MCSGSGSDCSRQRVGAEVGELCFDVSRTRIGWGSESHCGSAESGSNIEVDTTEPRVVGRGSPATR